MRKARAAIQQSTVTEAIHFPHPVVALLFASCYRGYKSRTMEPSCPLSASDESVVLTVLQDFCEKHPVPVLLRTCKVLFALIKNAATKADEKYRKVKLSNAKIQENVVKVADALDVLALAGFVAIAGLNADDDVLVYTPPTDESSNQLADVLCGLLQSKIEQLELSQQQQAPNNDSKKTTEKQQQQQQDSNAETAPPFLSERERQERIQKAKAARKAAAQVRKATQRRLEEDKQERLEIAKRKAALSFGQYAAAAPNVAAPPPGVSVQALATGRRIRQQDNSNVASSAPDQMDTDATMDVQAPNDDETAGHTTSMAALPSDTAADELWKTLIKDIPTCKAANNIRDTSFYKNQNHPSNARPVTCLKRLYQELRELETSLPNQRLATIWVRFDEETPQYIRALMSAPLGTPYAGGLFCFDVKIPNDYPNAPPSVILLTTGGGRVRFGPNLYGNGQVCLSLLGTWPGPKWSPSHSNLYQVLVSIQGLILGTEQPYFLEPGHGGWEGDVKDGDYLAQGQTLNGKKVVSEIGVPSHVQQYNNILRVGTVRYAMLETLSGRQRHLQAFEDEIHGHFSCNRNAIWEQIQQWPVESSDDCDTRMPQGLSAAVGNLKDLLPKLETRLSALADPSASSTKDHDEKSIGEQKMAAVPTEHLGSDKKQKTNDPNDNMEVESHATKAPIAAALPSKADDLRTRMQEAASSNNFILAGQLQEQLQKVEELESGIQKAAVEGNFIRAGRMQEQLESLLSTGGDSTAGPTTYAYDDSAQNEDQLSTSDGTDSIGGLSLGQNVHVPPGYPSSYNGAPHKWGSGHALNSATSQVPVSGGRGVATLKNNEVTMPGVVIRKKAPPASSVCRLRFRLPQSATHLEDFDRNAPLSTVYRSLETILSAKVQSDQMQTQSESDHAVAPPLRTHGAWAQPQSASGFTLLLSHPKREFNLEMHGTKTLTELGLVPSATLTIMNCQDRGLARRGEVESRLAEASGGAMDVEGLSYEGLLELTERVGAAKPTAITEEVLNENTTLLSPSDLMDDEDEAGCPICLGEYDHADTTKSLRKLHHCGHLMHAACLSTWLGTKSSCPVCKSSIGAES